MAAQPLIGIIMGSRSDWETMRHATETLEKLGVPHEARVVSAHRTPRRLFDYASTARDRGLTAMPAGALFGVNHTRLAVRRDSYLRGFALSFIELFAPNLDRARLEQLMRPGEAAAAPRGNAGP